MVPLSGLLDEKKDLIAEGQALTSEQAHFIPRQVPKGEFEQIFGKQQLQPMEYSQK